MNIYWNILEPSGTIIMIEDLLYASYANEETENILKIYFMCFFQPVQYRSKLFTACLEYPQSSAEAPFRQIRNCRCEFFLASSSYRVHAPAIIMLQPKLNTVPSTFIVFCKVLAFAIMLQQRTCQWMGGLVGGYCKVQLRFVAWPLRTLRRWQIEP